MSGQDYKLLKAEPKEVWSNDYGTFQCYELILDNYGSPVTLNRKLKDGEVPADKVPEAEQTLHLEINGTKAKEVQTESQSASNGAGANEPGRFDRKPEHPINAARMAQANALSSAPAYYDQMRVEGLIDKAESKEAYLDTIKGIARWLSDRINEAGEKVANPEDNPPF
jgi:hypothetical protein